MRLRSPKSVDIGIRFRFSNVILPTHVCQRMMVTYGMKIMKLSINAESIVGINNFIVLINFIASDNFLTVVREGFQFWPFAFIEITEDLQW